MVDTDDRQLSRLSNVMLTSEHEQAIEQGSHFTKGDDVWVVTDVFTDSMRVHLTNVRTGGTATVVWDVNGSDWRDVK